MKISTALCFVLALLTTGCVSWAEECRFTAPRDAEVALDGAAAVQVAAGPGSLRIDGRPGRDRITVSGTACASEESLLDEIELVTRRSGDTLIIEARFPEGRNRYEQVGLDLVIEVPDSLPLEVDDTSGPAEIAGVASLRMTDGSGPLWIDGVAGDVAVVDSSGELEISRVGGEVTIEDSSGEIVVQAVGGNIEIEDSSGGIDVRDAGRDVIIKQDSSGDIRVSGVAGDFLVRDDGSGGIDASDVQGDFTVERDGSGGIRHDRIGGRVSLPPGG